MERIISILRDLQFIFGTNFPESRLVKGALESFYGIGPKVSQRLMARFFIHPTARIGTLGDKQVNDIAAELGNMKIENDLRRSLQDNIKRLRDMGTYRGRRHAMSLPVRGQNTRSQVRCYLRLLHRRCHSRSCRKEANNESRSPQLASSIALPVEVERLAV